MWWSIVLALSALVELVQAVGGLAHTTAHSTSALDWLTVLESYICAYIPSLCLRLAYELVGELWVTGYAQGKKYV